LTMTMALNSAKQELQNNIITTKNIFI